MEKNVVDSTLFKNFIEQRFSDSLTDWIGQEKMDKLMAHVEKFLARKDDKLEVEIDLLKPEGATQDLELSDDKVYYYSRNKKNADDESCISNYDDFKYAGTFKFELNKGQTKIDSHDILFTNNFEFVNHATKVEVKLNHIQLRNSVEKLEQMVNLGALNTVYLENEIQFAYRTGAKQLQPKEDPLLFRFDSKKHADGINYAVVKKESSIGIFSKNKEYGYDLSENQLDSLKAGNAIYLDEEKQKNFFRLDAKNTRSIKKDFKLKKSALLNVSQSQNQQVEQKREKKAKLKL